MARPGPTRSATSIVATSRRITAATGPWNDIRSAESTG
jgi:hypothetical protein